MPYHCSFFNKIKCCCQLKYDYIFVKISDSDLRLVHSKYCSICLYISHLSTSYLEIRANTGWFVRKWVIRSLKLKERRYNSENNHLKTTLVSKTLTIEQHKPHWNKRCSGRCLIIRKITQINLLKIDWLIDWLVNL